MRYGKSFFDLQLRFARGISARTGMPFVQALLDCTNLYVRLNIGRGFDAGHPVWRDYVDGLASTADPERWTHDFYLARPEQGPPDVVARIGCFAYARHGEGRLRLHFDNAEDTAHSPFAVDRCERRIGELRALFAGVDGDERVIGTSWLYNLEGYRRLFPVAYLETARPAGPRLRNMPLWGQFLDRHGEVVPARAAILLKRLDALTHIDQSPGSFPLQPLALDAPAAVFHASAR